MAKTALQAAAAAQDGEKKRKKARGLLASAFALLGIAPDAVPAAGKMRKVTETHRHVKTEEESGASSSAEEEEEASAPTEKSGASSSMVSSGGSSSEQSSAEEESMEEEEASGPPMSSAKGGGKMEEEEEAAVAAGWKAAIHAYARKTRGVDAYGVRGPKGLLRLAEKATGAKGATAALAALATLPRGKTTAPAPKPTADAKVIRAIARTEAKVAKIAGEQRADRVEAVVQKAKVEGKATTHDLRVMLRAYGIDHSTKALKAFVASLPVAATSRERLPNVDERGDVVGAPGATEQKAMAAMFGDLKGDDLAKAQADFRRKMAKTANGAGRA